MMKYVDYKNKILSLIDKLRTYLIIIKINILFSPDLYIYILYLYLRRIIVYLFYFLYFFRNFTTRRLTFTKNEICALFRKH